ncbi:MAG: HD domain-containing protein [Bacteroidota bacterium]
MTESEILDATIAYVKKTLADAEGGHDWFHIERVYNTAMQIALTEEVDRLVVGLSALLHDIADAKFHNGDETIGPRTAYIFLASLELSPQIIERVVAIIKSISFKNTLEVKNDPHPYSIELKVVQDADRLDAIGAIGVARAFNYGGFKNRTLYNPTIAPITNITKAAYKKSTAPTINHFYEKLVLLKDMMQTKMGKALAEQRHQFLLDFLDQFYAEWNFGRRPQDLPWTIDS